MSGTLSHCQHHRVILSSLDRAAKGFEKKSAGGSGACCASGLVDAGVVQEIIAEMQRHGDVYDSAYAGKLEASS